MWSIQQVSIHILSLGYKINPWYVTESNPAYFGKLRGAQVIMVKQ